MRRELPRGRNFFKHDRSSSRRVNNASGSASPAEVPESDLAPFSCRRRPAVPRAPTPRPRPAAPPPPAVVKSTSAPSTDSSGPRLKSPPSDLRQPRHADPRRLENCIVPAAGAPARSDGGVTGALPWRMAPCWVVVYLMFGSYGYGFFEKEARRRVVRVRVLRTSVGLRQLVLLLI